MADYVFDDTEELDRNPEIEGKTGTVLDFPGDRWIRILAATDYNPKWKARKKIIDEAVARLNNSGAGDERYRKFWAPHIAECLGVDWGGWKANGAEIPYSAEAFKALLLSKYDVYRVCMLTMRDDSKYRGDRIEVVIAQGKASSSGTPNTENT